VIVGNVGSLNIGKVNPVGKVGIGGIGEDFWLVDPVPPILTW
jgi:hypothetical protein